MIRITKMNISNDYNSFFLRMASESNHFLYLARRGKNNSLLKFLIYALKSFFYMPNMKVVIELFPNIILSKIRYLNYKLKK